MKSVLKVAEAIKLYSSSYLIITVPLVLILSLGVYRANQKLFIVPVINSFEITSPKNLTHADDHSQPKLSPMIIEAKNDQKNSSKLGDIGNKSHPLEPRKPIIIDNKADDQKNSSQLGEVDNKSQPLEPQKPIIIDNKSDDQKNSSQLREVDNKSQPSEPQKPIVIEHKEDQRNTSDNPGKIEEECDIFDGKWVYNPENSPLYNSAQCPFLGEQVSCQKNGRPDSEYEKWTWEPKGCNIPRREIGKQMLEKLRDKRLIIVGDSLNRNQWESMACLLYSSATPSRARVDPDSGRYKVFRAEDYNCTVEFYWSPFLVDLVVNPKNGENILKLDKLVPSAKMWKGADVMVFNTGHWWSHHGKYQAWGAFHRNGKAVEIETAKALEMAMETWSRWIDKNVDSVNTRVFFRSISPEHKGKTWCYNQTQPILDVESSFVPVHPKPMVVIVEQRLREMKTPVMYLNITHLSRYRRDGHPSIYKNREGKNLVATNQTRPAAFSDCSHWCLPGVPDTWNTLLFLSLLSHPSKSITFS